MRLCCRLPDDARASPSALETRRLVVTAGFNEESRTTMKPPQQRLKNRKPAPPVAQSSPPKLSFSSEALLQQAIAGLLTRLPGVTGVQILQSTQELGKDIVFYINGGFGESMLCACVVKNTKITGVVGKPGGARTILFQAEQAFDSAHTDSFGRDVKVERVYVVTPFELPPATIASVSGRLKERAGQVRFIGASQLFDLFKKYWPDYFADEAAAIEKHLGQVRKLLVRESPLPALAFQYNLGSVAAKFMRVYVTQAFHRDINAYAAGSLLTSSLPNPEVLRRKISKRGVQEIQSALAAYDHALSYLQEWGLCPAACDQEGLKKSLEELIEEIRSDMRRRLEKTKVGYAAASPKLAIALFDAPRLEAKLRRQTEQRLRCATPLEDRLNKLSQLVSSKKLDWLTSLTDKRFMSACLLNDCAQAAPERIFSHVNKRLRVKYPKDILDRWGRSLLIVGAAGYGKTSFCRWHALQDAERFNVGGSDIIPVYIPLHQLSRKSLGSFEEVCLRAGGQSALIVKSREDTPSRVRLYLDGLDEIASPARRREVIRMIRGGAARHPSYQVVITSRDYIYGPWLNWLPKIYLSEFGDAEITEFLDKWLGKGTDINKRFYLQLKQLPALGGLMRIPLLATLVVMVFRQTARLPESKTRLYEIFVDLLSGGWDMTKGILRGSKFGQRIKIVILSSLAGRLHELRRREFADDDLKKAIQSSVSAVMLKEWRTLRDEFIADGLINLNGDVLQFPHLSFQEFLAAKDLIGTPHSQRVSEALDRYLRGEDWWKDVLKFYLGLASNSQEIADWLSHQIRRAAGDQLSIPHAHEMLAGFVEAFPEFSIEELAAKLRGTLHHATTVTFLEQVQKKAGLKKHGRRGRTVARRNGQTDAEPPPAF